MGHFFKTQPTQYFWTQPNPTQIIIDTWYGVLGYTEKVNNLIKNKNK